MQNSIKLLKINELVKRNWNNFHKKKLFGFVCASPKLSVFPKISLALQKKNFTSFRDFLTRLSLIDSD